jgi:hypothetical protein
MEGASSRPFQEVDKPLVVGNSMFYSVDYDSGQVKERWVAYIQVNKS